MVKVWACNSRNLSTTLGFFSGNSQILMLGATENLSRFVMSDPRATSNLANFLCTNNRLDEYFSVPELFAGINSVHRGRHMKFHVFGPSGISQVADMHKVFFPDDLLQTHEFADADPVLEFSGSSGGYLVRPIVLNSPREGSVTASFAIDCMGGSERLVFLSLPGEDYLGSLEGKLDICSEMWNTVVYHSVPYGVMSNPRYLDMVATRWPHSEHIIDCAEIAGDNCPRAGSNYITKQHHVCCPSLFPDIPLPFPDQRDEAKAQKLHGMLLERGIKWHRPVVLGEFINFGNKDRGASWSQSQPKQQQGALGRGELQFLEALDKYIEGEPKLQACRELCKPDNAKKGSRQTRVFHNEPAVLFLGTSSNISTAERNASAIYLNVPGREDTVKNAIQPTAEYFHKTHGILLDCGDGTYGQLFDHFCSPAVLRVLLSHIKLIFISHHHGDHINGLTRLIMECDKAVEAEAGQRLGPEGIWSEYPLFVALPSIVRPDIASILSNMNLKHPERIRMANTNYLNPDPELHYAKGAIEFSKTCPRHGPSEVERMIKELKQKLEPTERGMANYLRYKLGIQMCHTFETDHFTSSSGVVFCGPDWKIVYTGDTAPCTTLLNFASRTDLLIHECSYLLQPQNMRATKHSLLSDVQRICSEIRPWRTVLTHIVPAADVGETKRDDLPGEFIQARDHMGFRLADAEWVGKASSLLDIVKQ